MDRSEFILIAVRRCDLVARSEAIWNALQIVLARFVESAADKVSFSALGLRPDGKPDRAVEIKFQSASEPPMARPH